MKSITNIVGILLILAGVIGFAYGRFTYTTEEKVAQLGDLKITADKEKYVSLSPVMSGICLAAGVVLLAFGRRQPPNSL